MHLTDKRQNTKSVTVRSTYDTDSFTNYDNFFTLLFTPYKNRNGEIKRKWKTVFGHFFDNENMFLYVPVVKGKVLYDAPIRKCPFEKLSKNKNGETYRFHSVEEAYFVKSQLELLWETTVKTEA